MYTTLIQISKSTHLEADHCHLDHRNKVEVMVVSWKPLPPQEEKEEAEGEEMGVVAELQQQQAHEQRGMDRTVKQSLKKKQNIK